VEADHQSISNCKQHTESRRERKAKKAGGCLVECINKAYHIIVKYHGAREAFPFLAFMLLSCKTGITRTVDKFHAFLLD
jgi:hypothetical protein